MAGFIDADGSFYLKWTLNKLGIPIGLVYYLRLSQKQLSHLPTSLGASSFLIVSLIAELLNTVVLIIDRLRLNGQLELGYLVRTAKYNSHYAIVSYLLQYPLFSYKYRSPELFARLLQLSVSKSGGSAPGAGRGQDLIG